MRKRQEIDNPESCLNRAEDDEPLFVIRAKDKVSASAVRTWAEWALLTGIHEPEKIQEARAIAEDMENWRKVHYPDDEVTDAVS